MSSLLLFLPTNAIEMARIFFKVSSPSHPLPSWPFSSSCHSQVECLSSVLTMWTATWSHSWWLCVMAQQRTAQLSSGRWSGMRGAPTSSCWPHRMEMWACQSQWYLVTSCKVLLLSYTVSCYWPNFGSLQQYGNFIVEVEEESAEHVYTTRKILLTDNKV